MIQFEAREVGFVGYDLDQLVLKRIDPLHHYLKKRVNKLK